MKMMILLRLSEIGRTMEDMTMRCEGLAGAQHAERSFRAGGLVQVITDASVRQGEVAMVTAIRGAAYSVVTIHADGAQRVWAPEELAAVDDAGVHSALLAELDRLERIVREAGEGIDL